MLMHALYGISIRTCSNLAVKNLRQEIKACVQEDNTDVRGDHAISHCDSSCMIHLMWMLTPSIKP